MDLSQTIRQSQTLSPQAIHAAKILQMNAQELQAYLREALETNPALEEEEHTPDGTREAGDTARQQLEWLCTGDLQNASYYRDDAEDPTSRLPGTEGLEPETLYHHLRAQLDYRPLSPAIASAVELILQSLSPDGRLDEPLEDLAVQSNISFTGIQQAIQVVQSLDPPGVAARSLAECLELQLLRQGETGLPLTIVRRHLEDLAQNHLRHIAIQTGATRDAVEEAIQLIRALDPRPGAAFSPREHVGIILPELTVIPAEEGFDVLLNSRLPSLRISPYCLKLQAQQDPEVQAYLEEKLQQAKWVLKAVEMRHNTLLNCTRAIVSRQEAFFRQGPGSIKPLTLAEVAEMLSVHESTISRAVQGKHLLCRYGVFPLKYFFSRGLAGNEECTSEQAKEAIRRLISQEEPDNPLSDQALREHLVQEGINVSRRTVAKYREELSIPAAPRRKQR